MIANCRRCQDSGVYGGALDGTFAGPWKWCDCAAGHELRLNQPEGNYIHEYLEEAK